jgi:uncharacterized protein (DUF1697 family)
MTTHIALLRGINVGSSKRVPMAALREMLSGLGYTDVRTHLNSGNAVFGSDDSPSQVAAAIEKGLADELNVPAQVVVRSRDQLVAAMAADPLTAATDDGSKHFLGFLAAAPDPADVGAVPELADDADTAPDEVRLIGDHLYLWCPNGSLKATFSKVNWDKSLGTAVTVRNWNTVTKLAEIAAD